MRPMIDSRSPRRSDGTRSGSKPLPRSSTIRRDALVLDLRVQPDRTAVGGELRRVRERLAGRGDERFERLVERAVADHDDLDRRPARLFDLDRGGAKRVGDALVGLQRRRAREPRSQLALLAPRQLRDVGRVVGAALDEGQRLQHRVVQVRGQLGPLLGADPLRALGREAAGEPPPQRSEDQAEADYHHECGQRRVAGGVEHAIRPQEEQARPQHEGNPEAGHGQPARRLARAPRASRFVGDGLCGLLVRGRPRQAPQQRDAERG